MSLVLGIDPGSRVTGYGVIDVQGRRGSDMKACAMRAPPRALPFDARFVFYGGT